MRALVASFIFIGAALAAAPAQADGPVGYRPGATSSRDAPPELRAIEAYNAGYAAIQKADALSESQPKESREEYTKALKQFKAAVKLDGNMHEALTYIGYANRKLGHYQASLEAYEAALRINPDYPYAIEYQGEAFLGLDRIDEARFNYLRLYAIAPGQAAKLLGAMRAWAIEHEHDPSLATQAQELNAWISERPQQPAATGSSW